MKRVFIVLIIIIISLLVSSASATDPVLVQKITLSETGINLANKKEININAIVEPENASNNKVTWTSTDQSIAIVKNGKITAKSCGECDIICEATDGSGINEVCHVVVFQMVQNITTKNNRITIPIGESYESEVTIKPDNATDKTLIYSSSNDKICLVDAAGRITAKAAGDCEITISASDGSNISTVIKVHVPIFDGQTYDYEITDNNEFLIPIDLHGYPLSQIFLQASSSKSFMYYYDSKGLHILPTAIGKGTITISDRKTKKEKAVYNITVLDSAISSINPNKLYANIVINNPYIFFGDKITANYQITGGTKPYTIDECEWYFDNSDGSSYVHNEKLKGNSTGSLSYKLKKEYGIYNAYISLKLHDSAGNIFITKSNIVPVERIEVSFGKETIISEIGQPVTFSYYIDGGSGLYDVEATWTVRNIDANITFDTNKEKQQSTGDGTFTFTPTQGTWLGLNLIVKDKKNKNLVTYAMAPNGIFLSEDLHLEIEFDKKSVNEGESVVAHLICNNPSYLKGSYLYWQQYDKDDKYINETHDIEYKGNECYVKCIPVKSAKSLVFGLSNPSEFYFKGIPVND